MNRLDKSGKNNSDFFRSIASQRSLNPYTYWFERIVRRFYGWLKSTQDLMTFHQALKMGLLRVGKGTYGMPRIHWYANETGAIEIGNFCSIGPEVNIFLSGNHPWWVTTYPLGKFFGCSDERGDFNTQENHTVIGSDVWIGYGATILGNVTIGDGAVIGANAVVASNIPPYAIAVGNPARVIRYRFEPSKIEQLLKIRWWSWDDEQIFQALSYLSSSDIISFIKKYGSCVEEGNT